jgi:Fic family protein
VNNTSSDEYIDKLFAVSAQAGWRNWVEFCLRATLSQAKDTFDRCSKLLALRETYRRAVGDRKRLPLIVDILFSNQFVRPSTLAQTLDVTYPTAKGDIEQLVKLAILRELPTVYPKTYYALDIYNIAFAEPDSGAPPATE